MLLQKGDRLLMIGDSITDAGRGRPVGESPWPGIGNGYVSLVEATLGARHPETPVRIMNMGTSGNTIRDLGVRWQADVLDLAPTVVTVMIGINDVWRQFDVPQRPEAGVPLEEYRDTLDGLVSQTRPLVRAMLLATPFYIEPNRSDPMRARMDEYGAAVREVAVKHGCSLIDTQAAFDRVLQHVYPAALAGDRVHPNLTGSFVLARAFLDALGAEG
jgi:lysophospholipase L1-like esterase